jgi:hypothetical protein
MLISIYARLFAAFEAERERQLRLLEHDREITKAKTWAGKALVGSVEALAGKGTKPVE